MKNMYRAAWPLVIAVSAVCVFLAWRGYASAKHDAALAVRRAAQIAAHVSELERVRPVALRWQERKRPASGLAASLGETLTGCGVPASALVSVTPQPESAVQGPGAEQLKRQRATLTLSPITLPQLGAFLEAWRAREPYWTVGGIDVGPDQRSAAKGSPGGDLPLTAVLTLDAVYLDDAKERAK